ncbi:CdaR family transcriptional regulator [Dendrosporobacter sp. 1207_IL3150]|uniref:CdaR family transcriptional regulator n=1 Tax=Dendrosporobacter sp. 1207_IL3150 TaxID=3084054 RepID=UPI002FDA311B
MIISTEMAQSIVDQLMDIVQRNVNIIDCNGIILASGQGHRINTFHQGGLAAANTKNVIEIQVEDVAKYTGALPGVMWPINIKGRIVGVVGVTGEPCEVRNTAKLVKTVTELVLEREMFLADYRSENRVKAQLVNLLFSDNPDLISDDVYTLAEMLNYTIKLPRRVMLIQLEPLNNYEFSSDGLQNLYSDRIRETVLNKVKESPFLNKEDICLFYKKNLCLIKSESEQWETKKRDNFAEQLVTMLSSIQPHLKVQVGLGGRALNESQLRLSFNEAKCALDFSSDNTIRSIHDPEILLSYLFKADRVSYDDSLILQELKLNFDQMKDSCDMSKTLDYLLKNNLNVSLTADKLFIHRNTLKFRLEKFKKFVGLDPCHFFQHAMLCKIILYMEKTDCSH